jgi:hypothetical protein
LHPDKTTSKSKKGRLAIFVIASLHFMIYLV